MKKFCKKLSDILRWVFGWGILVCLLAGGLTFLGYVAALCIGGDTAAAICQFIYKTLFPYIIRTSTVLVLLGLVVMYLGGETALTANKKKAAKHEGEM